VRNAGQCESEAYAVISSKLGGEIPEAIEVVKGW
jgi:hypothetical protein